MPASTPFAPPRRGPVSARPLLLWVAAAVTLLVIAVRAEAATDAYTQREDFETGAQGWDLPAGWSISADGPGYVLQSGERGLAVPDVEGTVDEADLKLKLLRGTFRLNLRHRTLSAEGDRYAITVDQAGSYLDRLQGTTLNRLAGGRGLPLQTWHALRVRILTDRIQLFANDELILDAEQKEFLPAGSISLEGVEETQYQVDDLQVQVVVPDLQVIPAGQIFAGGEHRGDLTLAGNDWLVLENATFLQYGSIYLKDRARLTLRNATLQISRYQQPGRERGIFLQDQAVLQATSAKLVAGTGTMLVAEASGRSRIQLRHTPAQLHRLSVRGNVRALVDNSEVLTDTGGLVEAVGQAVIKVVGAKVGAVQVYVPVGSEFRATGLSPGFRQRWVLREHGPLGSLKQDIGLYNTTVSAEQMDPGPGLRGWLLALDAGAKVDVKESTLRRVTLNLGPGQAQFVNLALLKRASLRHGNISLENVTVTGQWGFSVPSGAEVTLRRVDGLRVAPTGTARLTLINSQMNELSPRRFLGTLEFANARWDNVADIAGDNSFTITGSLDLGILRTLIWEKSAVYRTFPVQARPETTLTLRKGTDIVWEGRADVAGRALFGLQFTDATLTDEWELTDATGATTRVDFFASTPIAIGSGVSVFKPGPPGYFPDLEGHWAQATVEEATQYAYVRGYPDGSFQPERSVTRAELVKMAVGAARSRQQMGSPLPPLSPPAPSTPALAPSSVVPVNLLLFPDLTGHWLVQQGYAEPDLMQALADLWGIPEGGPFGVDFPATRAETAAMVAYLMTGGQHLLGTSADNAARFRDMLMWSHPGKLWVGIATELNLITGFPDNTFRPNQPVSRAQAVVILERMRARDVPLALQPPTRPGSPPAPGPAPMPGPAPAATPPPDGPPGQTGPTGTPSTPAPQFPFPWPFWPGVLPTPSGAQP